MAELTRDLIAALRAVNAGHGVMGMETEIATLKELNLITLMAYPAMIDPGSYYWDANIKGRAVLADIDALESKGGTVEHAHYEAEEMGT